MEDIMFTNFLAPISGDVISNKTLKEVSKLAKLMKAKITLVYVSDPMLPYMYMDGTPAYYGISEQTHKKACDDVAKRIFSKAQSQLGSDVIAKTYHIYNPNVFQGIIDAAKKSKADVIVMASHKRSGMAGIFMGSDTNALIMHTKLPVIVL
jgi:nucleotide-binding universal stress UspA family protein